MNGDSRALGQCPVCGETVLVRHVIVEYQTTDGTDKVWASCPGCEDVIDPT